jgi:hypothetical protein
MWGAEDPQTGVCYEFLADADRRFSSEHLCHEDSCPGELT